MTNAEFQEQNELLQAEVVIYKQVLETLKEFAIKAHVANSPTLYKELSEFTHKSIVMAEITIEDMYKDDADTEPYERDYTTDNQQDS